MPSCLLSLALLGLAAAADCPSPPALSPACSSALPHRQDHACAIRLGHQGGPVERRGRKVRDYLDDDDDADEETSSGSPQAGASGLLAGPNAAADLVRTPLREAAGACRSALVPLIYAYCTLLL
jgi:hypothetical protein